MSSQCFLDHWPIELLLNQSTETTSKSFLRLHLYLLSYVTFGYFFLPDSCTDFSYVHTFTPKLHICYVYLVLILSNCKVFFG